VVKEGKSKYAWMLVLMISSQLLLTAFVTYWLISQYKQERKLLNDQLSHELLSAYDQQVDSLLMKHLIAPTLRDSVTLRVNLSGIQSVERGSDSVHTSVIIKHLEHDTLPPPEIFAFRMNDSLGLEEERMVRSVKLFINETDESFRNDARAHAFSMKIDSSALLQTLDQIFMDRDWDFTTHWFEESTLENLEAPGRGLVLMAGSHMELPALHVKHIGPYLLGLMLPQFLFALILLSLSGAALIIAFRSLKKQLVLNELRNDFIANISHELKTPVSTVKVALEALQKFDLKKDPKASGDYLKMASRETERLEGLVGKVLLHQVLEDSQSLLQQVSCDLNQLIDEALKAMEIPIREQEATIKVTKAADPCLVTGDPVYLEGLIINLIDNSLKYAGPRVEIQINLECTPDGKYLKVADNGPGIPETYKHQIFEKFFRIPAGNQHNVKGYGLGLNFAAQVMTQVGGSISFRNLPEGGCVFVLDFPNN
jgi:signal transduction histidine kinase